MRGTERSGNGMYKFGKMKQSGSFDRSSTDQRGKRCESVDRSPRSHLLDPEIPTKQVIT